MISTNKISEQTIEVELDLVLIRIKRTDEIKYRWNIGSKIKPKTSQNVREGKRCGKSRIL